MTIRVPDTTICPHCHGRGEHHYLDWTVSPNSGVSTLDPQHDFTEPCTHCDGTGSRPTPVTRKGTPAGRATRDRTNSLSVPLLPTRARPPLRSTRERRGTDKQRPQPVRAGGA